LPPFSVAWLLQNTNGFFVFCLDNAAHFMEKIINGQKPVFACLLFSFKTYLFFVSFPA